MIGLRWWLTAVIPFVAALSACTGTFTPATPTLYLVFLDPDAGTPARVALLSFQATPTERRLELVTAESYRFAIDEHPVAIDVLDREGRQEVWVLTAVGSAASRETRLVRIDLRAVADAPGTELQLAEPPLPLTDAGGAWVGLESASAQPSGCLSGLVVQASASVPASGEALALWDAGSGQRCGSVADVDPRVHVLDLVEARVRATIADAVAPGVRPGDPDEADALLLVRRPPVGDPEAPEVVPVTFTAPVPDLGAAATAIPALQDVAGIPGGIAALRGGDGTGRTIEIRTGGTTRQRTAPNGANRLLTDETGRLENLLTTGGGRIGVTYANEETTREVAFDAIDLAVEPLNAYALAVRATGGLCLVDLLIASGSSGCDLPSDAGLAAALPSPRFITWTYAAPTAPTEP